MLLFRQKNILIISIFMLSFAFMAAGLSAWAVEIHGHRGARAAMPENTLAAFDYALEIGVDYIELDVRFSKDNEIIVVHDPNFDERICLDPNGHSIGQEVFFRLLNIDQIQQYDCGSLPHPNFPNQSPMPGERVPSLRDVFELVTSSSYEKATSVGMHIELKTDPTKFTPTPNQFAHELIGIIEEFGFLDRVILQSFDGRFSLAANREAKRRGQNIQRKVFSPPYQLVTGLMVDLYHLFGYKVIPWTPNTPQQWHALVTMGVDGIITDDPLGLKNYLNQILVP